MTCWLVIEESLDSMAKVSGMRSAIVRSCLRKDENVIVKDLECGVVEEEDDQCKPGKKK